MSKNLEEKLKERQAAKIEGKIIRNSFLDHDTLLEIISMGYEFLICHGDKEFSNKVIIQNDRLRAHLGYNKKESVYYFTAMPLAENDYFAENKLNELRENSTYKYLIFKEQGIFKKGKDEYRFTKDKDTGKLIMSYNSDRKKVLYFFMTLANFYSNPNKIMHLK